MEAAQLLALLPDNILEEFALEPQVDKYTKKLYGKCVVPVANRAKVYHRAQTAGIIDAKIPLNYLY